MKLQNSLALGFGLALVLSAQTYAAPTVSNPINEDLFFSNGVQLQDIREISEGVASVTLEGTGSITVGSQSSGGFPRVAVSAGTTITSTRSWPAETVPKTSWDGQLSAPGSGRLPAQGELAFPTADSQGHEYMAVDAYVWGLSNETFSFSNGAKFVFPVDEQDGQRLWIATASGSSWAVDSNGGQYCTVDSGLCHFTLTSFGGVALVKKIYETCSRESIENGNIGSAPNCIVTCEPGYMIDTEGNECLADALESTSEAGGDDFGAEEEPGLEEYSAEDQEALLAFADEYGVDPLELIALVPGAVRLRGSVDSIRYYLTEYSDLTDEEIAKVRQINLGYLSRNPRSSAEQLASKGTQEDPAVARQKDTSFMNYLLQMRNNFAEQDMVEAENQEAITEGTLENMEEGESVAAAEGFHSSGGKLLPSTGPGLFITIAIIGFILMLFGGIRRN